VGRGAPSGGGKAEGHKNKERKKKLKLEKKEMEKFGGAYILSHPVRAVIIKFLKREKAAYTSQIAEALGFSPRLVGFHLSMLLGAKFVESEYRLTNPATNPPRVARYYRLTPKVDDTLRTFVDALK